MIKLQNSAFPPGVVYPILSIFCFIFLPSELTISLLLILAIKETVDYITEKDKCNMINQHDKKKKKKRNSSKRKASKKRNSGTKKKKSKKRIRSKGCSKIVENNKSGCETVPLNINKDVPMFNTQVPLTKILNYLDPLSFQAVAATCKYMRELCLSSNEIMIYGGEMNIVVAANRWKTIIRAEIEDLITPINPAFMEKIKRLPFFFFLSIGIKGPAMNHNTWNEIRNYVNGFRHFEIEWISCAEDMDGINWEQTFDFMKTFDVAWIDLPEISPPEGIQRILLSLKMDHVSFRGKPSIQKLAKSSIERIYIYGSRYSLNDIKTLIQCWFKRKMQSCHIEVVVDFTKEAFLLFLENNYTLVNGNHEGSLPTKRPLLFFKDNCYFKDNSYNMLFKDDYMIGISFHEEDEIFERYVHFFLL